MTINPEVIHVPADDGIDLHTWLYWPPQATGPVPVISMAHGFGGMKYHGLDG